MFAVPLAEISRPLFAVPEPGLGASAAPDVGKLVRPKNAPDDIEGGHAAAVLRLELIRGVVAESAGAVDRHDAAGVDQLHAVLTHLVAVPFHGNAGQRQAADLIAADAVAVAVVGGHTRQGAGGDRLQVNVGQAAGSR